MATKRVSTSKTAKSNRAATAAPELQNGASVAVESPPLTAGSTWIDPDVRRQLVSAEAYFLAERRGFAAGRELEDWAAAEVVIDSRLQQMHAN